MRKNLYRAFSALMIVAVLTSSTMSSFAAPAVPPVVVEAGKYVAGAFFDVVLQNGIEATFDFIKDHIGFSAGKVCKSSTDGYHHCESSAFSKGTGGVDDEGRYSTVVCKYCGESFKYYSSFNSGHGGGFSSDLQQSYEAQVNDIQNTYGGVKVDASGGWFLVPKLTRFYLIDYGTNKEIDLSVSTFNFSSSFTPSFSAEGIVWWITEFDFSSFPSSAGTLYLSYVTAGAPYRFSLAPLGTVNDIFLDRMTTELYASSEATTTLNCKRGGSVTVGPGWHIKSFLFKDGIAENAFKSGEYCTFSINFDFLHNFFYFVPDVPSVPDINSRPTSITGDYGIIGDNGEITKVDSNTIVNETNKTVYNPVTNTTSNVTDWQYDYSTRTYKLTLDNGTTSTVTYGDENVTIQEGDTVYNVYYLLEDSGSDTPGPDAPTPCDHSWTETSTTPPTCTVPGSRLLTCSLCNQTKTEAIPAPGHTWQIKQTVATQYDETGQLTQQGYTIFECSVCHEQYKSEDGTAPPGGSDPPGEDSGFLDSLAQKITSTLSSVLETVFSIFDEVPSLFDGFLAFLSAMFPYLPPEIITLLTFGIAAVVFIGIVKAFRR